MEAITINYKGYLITTDKTLMKVDDVHSWISEESYWAKGIPFEIFKKSFDHSFCAGALFGDKQIAFARLLTDYAVFGYLADVYVEEEHRGKGISKKMLEIIFGLDWVRGLRNIKLGTRDAHGLYEQYGFTDCKHPERMMELNRQDIYKPLTPEGEPAI